MDLPSPRTGRDDISAVPGAAADSVIVDPSRGYALWVFDAGLACCAVECAAALTRVSGGPPGPAGAGPDSTGPDRAGPDLDSPDSAAAGPADSTCSSWPAR